MTGRHRVRLRLTAWYAGITFALLLGAAVLSRATSIRAIEREFHAGQEASATLARSFFRAELNEYRAVHATLAHITAELVFPDRRLLFVTPGGDPWRPPAGTRAPRLPDLDPPVHWAEYPLDPELAPGWRIRLGVSRAAAERQRRSADLLALLAIPLAAVAAGLVGWAVAGGALRPIVRMAAAAEAITGAQPAGRLPVDAPADEIGRLGTAFNALLARLDEALAQQRRFLADAAHELRTPLARARGAVDVARQRPPTPVADRDALDRTHRELAFMSRLVDELLLLARADAQRRPPDLRPGFIDDVITDVVVAFEPLARQRDVALDGAGVEEAPARLDPELVRQLAGILVDNAIRYTGAGGRVTVTVRRDPAGRSVLRVADTGIGIDPAEAPHLFERFHRGERARAMSADGAGLGLAIARWIADQHGADLTILPGEGGGTVATVRFPHAATVAAPPPSFTPS